MITFTLASTRAWQFRVSLAACNLAVVMYHERSSRSAFRAKWEQMRQQRRRAEERSREKKTKDL